MPIAYQVLVFAKNTPLLHIQESFEYSATHNSHVACDPLMLEVEKVYCIHFNIMLQFSLYDGEEVANFDTPFS